MTLKGHKEPAGKHRKHADLARPIMGNFARNEWAFVGAQCTTIKVLAGQIITALSPKYKCGYADTTHNDDLTALPGRLADNAFMEYTDQVNYSQFSYNASVSPFKQRELFAEADLVLVNGNHQQAKAQIVIIDWNKENSLQKRLKYLTNVQLFLLADNCDDLFDFVKEAVTNWQEIPILRLADIEQIVSFFSTKLAQAKPALNGLVLAGGKSQRMGFDKGAANWFGKEQRYFMADMLQTLCDKVYISRSSEKQEISADYPVITDTFLNLGPLGAILSAFRERPDCAWLVVACDLPLLNKETLKYLVQNRDTASIATAFQSPDNEFPEPLITIWEPKSYPVLLSFLAQGYSCPRKVLINGDPKLLKAPDPDALTNVNTPDDLEKIKRILHQKIATA
ncbi:MAG: NTP transferase domain-containing protein [Mucilaginibacter sp.]